MWIFKVCLFFKVQNSQLTFNETGLIQLCHNKSFELHYRVFIKYFLLYKNYQPIGVTVHSHCVESSEGVLNDIGEGRVAVNCEKNTFFPEHPVRLEWTKLPIGACRVAESGARSQSFQSELEPEPERAKCWS